VSFKVEPRGESACEIISSPGGDDSGDFVRCVQKALKNLWLDITVDISAHPPALGGALPHLLKLQKVLESHGKSVVIKGLWGKVPNAYLDKIKNFGLLLAEDPLVYTILGPTLTQEVTQEMQPSSHSAGDLIAFQKTLGQSLKRKRFLESERKNYIERIKALSKGQDMGHIDPEQMESIAKFEQELVRLHTMRGVKQKELEEAQTALAQAMAVNKEKTSQLQTELKKKKDPLDKKLSDLNKKLEKMRADYKKKADSRKEKLQKAQAKKSQAAP